MNSFHLAMPRSIVLVEPFQSPRVLLSCEKYLLPQSRRDVTYVTGLASRIWSDVALTGLGSNAEHAAELPESAVHQQL